MDTHYTPTALARSLVASASHLRPRVIADLAAGRGDLLLEAERHWPSASYLGSDIDPKSILHLANIRPSWNVGRCDLRNPRSRSSCRALRNARGSVCLLLLNPPFSCRGGTRYAVHTSLGAVSASAALSFLLLAVEYVAADGHIVCILPYGCLKNMKDVDAWIYLKERFDVALLGTHLRGAFPHSAAHTALVHLSPRSSSSRNNIRTTIESHPDPSIRATITRGGCQLHRLTPDNSKPILVHYTDLREGSVILNGLRGSGSHRCVQGPIVLIPRVGRITESKVAVMDHSTSVMLSDCTIGIKPEPIENVYMLRDRIVGNFNALREQYVGTGAPFITLGRLREALSSMGVQVD